MDHLIITQIIERLERGRDSVHHIRDLLNQHPGFTADHDDQGYHKGLDDHSMVALTALDYALSMLHHPDNFSLEENQFGNSKSHDSAAETPRKDRRGCYKRRRNVESVVVDTTAPTDDGFAWRKYGQKVILNSTHPRNYYRCTHKTDQGCQATKQVQQISENPTKYRTIYHGKHTCKNPLKIPSFFINSTTPENPDSSVYLSFETNISAAKQRLNPPSPSNFPFSNSMVKPEYEPIKEETQSEPSDHHDHDQDNSSPSSPDPTTTTSRSEISSGEVYSSVASPHEMDMGEDYYRLLMAAETVNLDQVFQSLRYT